MARIPKIHTIRLTPIISGKYQNWRGKPGLSFFSEKNDQYLVSGEINGSEEIIQKIQEAEKNQQEIEVEFVKKYRLKFVNKVK